MMIKQLFKVLKSIDSNTFQEFNPSSKVVYPFTTFSVDASGLDTNIQQLDLSLNLFDCSKSYSGLDRLEEKWTDGLNAKIFYTSGYIFKFRFERSNTIMTGDDRIKRKEIVFEVVAYKTSKLARQEVIDLDEG